MEKERKTKTLATVALIVAVLGLTVAFAAMSTTLTINGTAEVNTASWDIHFENLSNAITTGDAKEIKAPVIKNDEYGKIDTYIGDFEISLTKPGDSVSYTFDVVNDGTINATSSLVMITNPTCISKADPPTQNDANIVCDNIDINLTYTDDGSHFASNHGLTAGSSHNLTLKISYDGDELPTDDVLVDGINVTLKFKQSNY